MDAQAKQKSVLSWFKYRLEVLFFNLLEDKI